MSTATGTTDPGVRDKLHVERYSDGNVTLLRFIGTIDEAFEGKKLAAAQKGGGALLLDLGEVERISSFGIREWVDFVTAVGQKASLWFIECAPKVVDQFNMVANFGGPGHLVSFYAPFRCDYCDDDRRRLVRVFEEADQLKSGRLPDRVCESCGNAEYLDEDAATFFSFLQAHPPVPTPPEVAAFLETRLNYAADAGARKLKIEKAIDGRATFLKLSGDLDASFPRDKIADGAEGDVIFDLAGIGKIDPAGAAEWRQMMAQIAAPSERILIVGAPASFVERLTRVEDLGQKGLILSFAMPYSCPSCRATAARTIDVVKNWELIKLASAPELKCPDCGSPTACAASEALLAHLPSLPRPDIPDELRRQVEKFQQEAPKPPPPERPLAAPATVARGGVSWLTALVAVAIVVVGAGAWLVGKSLMQRRGGEKLEASQPTRPAWVDQVFYREGERLLFVGHSTLIADKADGFAEAEAGALEEIVNQIGLSVRDPAFIDEVREQYEPFRQKAIADLEKATAVNDAAELERARRLARDGKRRVAAAFKKTAGALFPSERNDLYWEKLATADGAKYKVSIRYAVPKATFEKLVEAYATPAQAMGSRAVTYFPALAWRYDLDEGAVLTRVGNDSMLRFAGIQEGDLVLAGMDRVVHDARSYQRVLDEETAALAQKGGTLLLKVKRGDSPAIDTRLRIARGGQASADASNRLKQTHRPKSESPRSKNQTGNIWDDNPEE